MGKALSRLLGKGKEEQEPVELAEEEDGGNICDNPNPMYTTTFVPRHRPPPLPAKFAVKKEEEHFRCKSCGKILTEASSKDGEDDCRDCAVMPDSDEEIV